MLPSSSNDAVRAALARADNWLYEQGRIALYRVHDTNSDTVLRSIKARTEILFWWRYVSPELNSQETENLLSEFERRDLGLLLSVFRHNPELSSLFFALFFSLKETLIGPERDDVEVLADYLLSYPRERTLFRTLDHCHSTSRFFDKAWPNEAARSLLKESCLPFDGNILVHNEEMLYAITHTVFYATDFGKELSLLRDFPDAPLGEFLSYLMRRAVADNDLDILSELALCLMFMGQAQLVDEHTFEHLLKNQSSQGFWPATQSVIDAVEADDIPCEQIAFFAHYHTTLLARDVLARHLAGIEEADLSVLSPKPPALRASQPPQIFCACRDAGDMSDLAASNPRVKGVIRVLQAMETDLGYAAGRGCNTDALLRKISENDFVGAAIEIPVARPAPHIEKLVRFFHSANKSKLTGYGFPNPYGENYQVDRVVMALAGNVIEKKIDGWDCSQP